MRQYTHKIDDDTSWQLLSYYDRYEHNTGAIVDEKREQYNIDFQYQFSPREYHKVIMGANYRN